MIEIRIDQCQKCGLCMKVCPSKIIRENKEGYPEVNKRAEPFCIHCSHCFSICPVGAVIYDKRIAMNPQILNENIEPEKVNEIIKKRRSIRHYKDRLVSQNVLEEILDLTKYVPSGSNDRQVSFTVISGKDKTDYLSELAIEWVKENNQMKELVKEMRRGNNLITCGAPHLIIAHANPEGSAPFEDAIVALTTIELATTPYGLGACWAGFFMRISQQSEKIREYLQIPSSHKIYGALMVGYPKYVYHRLPEREDSKINWL